MSSNKTSKKKTDKDAVKTTKTVNKEKPAKQTKTKTSKPPAKSPTTKKKDEPTKVKNSPAQSKGGSKNIGLSPSKVVAFIGSLFLFWDSISMLQGGAQSGSILAIIGGILGILFSFLVLISLKILIGEIKIPYEWWVLLLMGIVMIFLFPLAGLPLSSMLGAILILLAGIVELLVGSRKVSASVIVLIAGIVFVFIESIPMLLSVTFLGIFLGIIGLFIGVILILILPIIRTKFSGYYQWWFIMMLASILVFAPIGAIGGRLVAVAAILVIMTY
jgi:hypothetical protein